MSSIPCRLSSIAAATPPKPAPTTITSRGLRRDARGGLAVAVAGIETAPPLMTDGALNCPPCAPAPERRVGRSARREGLGARGKTHGAPDALGQVPVPAPQKLHRRGDEHRPDDR